MLTTQWCLFDLFNMGRLPPLSLFEFSFIATFSIIQVRTLLCNRVHGCLCSEAYTKQNLIPFLWTAGGRKLVHFATECNPLHHSTQYLFIYPPGAILVCRIPGEENALSHSLYLRVLDWCWCVRAGQGRGWRMGNWSLVDECQGNLHIHNCFSRFELGESIEQKSSVIYLPHR